MGCDAAANLLAVECGIIIRLKLVEHAAGGFLHLGKIEGTVIVLVERRERRGCRKAFCGTECDRENCHGETEGTECADKNAAVDHWISPGNGTAPLRRI